MKVKVLVTFRDKHNLQKVYEKGKTYTFSKERIDEILQTGKFVEPVEEKKDATASAKAAEKKATKAAGKKSE